jgi:MFS family permease
MKRILSFFVAARTVSILGDRISDVVLPLAVLAASGSAVTAGLVGAAVQLPQVVAALHVGSLVDRRERRGLMIGADVLRSAAYAAIGVEIVLGGAHLIPVLVLGLLIGLGDSAFNAAAGSYLPNIVDDRDLMRANGFVEGADAAATLTGPAAGGWIMQVFGSLVAFVVNAASFVVSALLLSGLPGSRPAETGERAPGDASMRAGFRLLLRDRQQRLLLAGAAAMHLLAAATFLPLVVRMRTDLGLAPGTIGLVVSAAGIGGLVSGLVLARFVDTRPWPPLLAAVLGVNAAAVATVALVDSPGWLAAVVLVLDGASALAFIVVATAGQRITPNHLRGRLITASTAVTAGVRMLAIGSVGALTDALGASAVLIGLALSALPFLTILLVAGSGPARCADRSAPGNATARD